MWRYTRTFILKGFFLGKGEVGRGFQKRKEVSETRSTKTFFFLGSLFSGVYV